MADKKEFLKNKNITEGSKIILASAAVRGAGRFLTTRKAAIDFKVLGHGIKTLVHAPTKATVALNVVTGLGVVTGIFKVLKGKGELSKKGKTEFSALGTIAANDIGGGLLGAALGFAGLKGIGRLAKFQRGRLLKQAARQGRTKIGKEVARTPKILGRGEISFRRIRGRLVPIRIKNVR